MNNKTILACVFLLSVSIKGLAQTEKENKAVSGDTTQVNILLDSSKANLSEDPSKSIRLAIRAKEMAEKLNFEKGKAKALKNIGLGYYYQGKYPETLEYWNESLQIFENLKDDVGVANLLNNIGAVYNDQGDDPKALEYSLKSLKISEQLGDKLRIFSALNTIGNIYYNKKGTIDKALDYFLRALPLCEEIGNTEALGIISENIGEIYFDKKDNKKAVEYYQKSIKALGNSANSPFAYNGIGKVYLQEGNLELSLFG